jgi:CDP-glucose 4,6-dehydratase
MNPRLPSPAFWRGQRVFITGHTGFKGGWLALWLKQLGAEVTGYARAPDQTPALFELAEIGRGMTSIIGDLAQADQLTAAMRAAAPGIVLHLAAQPLVRRSLAEPVETFASNVMGTVNLLEAVRATPGVRACLVVTTDKVYANREDGRPFAEADALGGKDPYSASKAACEMVVRAWREGLATPVPLATARGGNVIGGGDFSADRLIPDAVRAVQAGEHLVLRHPESTRPWQHVLDCLNGYLLYAEALAEGRAAEASLNIGPTPESERSVGAVADAILAALGAPGGWRHAPVPGSVEMKALALDSARARDSLGWSDLLPGDRAIGWTADWYRAWRAGEAMRAVTIAQISAFGQVALAER